MTPAAVMAAARVSARLAAKPPPSATELLAGRVVDDEDKELLNSNGKRRPGPEKVRVWWPPTRDKSRTGFSGAFWPATIVGRGKAHFEVRYDNGEAERVHFENVFPGDAPVAFGAEIEPFQVGEFVEVFNGSDSDPCAWLGCVRKVSSGGSSGGGGGGVGSSSGGGGSLTVRYPFHDAPDETVKPALVRRARVWDGEAWKLVAPGQTWRDGEVVSPKELHLVGEREYRRRHLGGGGAGGGAGGKGRGGGRKAAAARG